MLAPLLLLQLGAFAHRADVPPNVLVVVVDDVGVDQIGCYAASYPGLALAPCTPNIDQLAAGGVRFTNAWSNPVCSPTRAQILTGKPGVHTGVGEISTRGPWTIGNHGLQTWELTLAGLLTGHQSAALGKWHVSDPLQDGDAYLHPLWLGFGSYAGSLYGLDPDYDDWTKCLAPPGSLLPHHPSYATSDTTDDALAALGSLQEPWLLYVAYNAAHEPFHCPSDAGYDTGACQHGACAQDWCQDCPSLVGSPLCTTVGADACRARAMVHALDAEIGELLAAVDLQRTAVLLLSDNGSPAGATVAPFDPSHAKGTLWQGGIHVPLIARVPGATPGVRHELVVATDLFATLADLAGVTPPPDPLRDSFSLLPLLFPAGPQGPKRTIAYAEFFRRNFVPQDGAPPASYLAEVHHRAVRNDAYKLIELRGWNVQAGACQSQLLFYQLADAPPQDPAFGPDPFEQNDLMPAQASWTPAQQAAFAELAHELALRPRLPTICP